MPDANDHPAPRVDARAPIDPRIDSPGREGLTGTAPSDAYASVADAELVTRAPDGRPMDAQPSWRGDFPIDVPQDAYVERRDFMKLLVLTSLAFSVGQLWIAAQNWWRRRQGRPAMARVASLDALAAGTAMTFAYPGAEDPCLLVRTPAGELVAYGQKCTHLSCAVRPRLDLGLIECPCHHGFFDLATGRPVAGPPQRPLSRIALEVYQGDVYATAVEERTV